MAKKEENKTEDDYPRRRGFGSIGTGLAIGIGIGVAMGNIAIGVGVGIAMGLGFEIINRARAQK